MGYRTQFVLLHPAWRRHSSGALAPLLLQAINQACDVI
jgi:hypothetical protein